TAILKINEKDSVCKFDIRYPVTYDGKDILRKLEALGTKCCAEYELLQHKPPLYVEKDRPFIKELEKAYEESTGQTAGCIAIGGGTYCRYVKNTVSFGPVFPGQQDLAHQANEYITLEDLRKITKIYAQAIYNLIK
ncbi:MAG: M20/M25/M40 family metallo-hydrolase, partial [Lachnospiraceae bacterium]|nr:M20/M25/M40 family metallo-hydrolase [Lachnospiraceae bacterium]